MLHPATMFLLLTIVVVFLSWIFNVYGLNVMHPQTGVTIDVENLLSPEGARWFLRHVVTNFTGFAPLGMVLVAMFGVGVAEHSGFMHACIRSSIKRPRNKRAIILWIIFLGILSNVIGDSGYIFLIPIAATLFHSIGLHPIAGIITAYVSVACGYSANIVISTLDPLMARTTQEALAAAGMNSIHVGPLSNYFFMLASTFLVGGIIYWLTIKKLIPFFGENEGEIYSEEYKPLSRRELRAIRLAFAIGCIFVFIILWSTFSSSGFLRGVSGGLIRSPFIVGILFLLALCAGVMGTVYGFSSGRYRTDKDVVEGLAQPMKILAVYVVIAFFASQMFACLEYSRLDKCLAILGANYISSMQVGAMSSLLLFIFYTALINLMMVSATAKWAFMAFIFVPLFTTMGIEPELTQCAFRVGDSATNAITPFLFYMPLVLTYMQRYDEQSTYATLFKLTWRYTIYILVFWTLLFVVWYLLGWPVGL